MKQFPHLISKLFYEPLVILPARHAALCQLVEAKMGRLRADDNPDLDLDDGPQGRADGREDDEDLVQKGDTAIIPVHGTLVRYPEDIAMSECGCDMDTLSQRIDMVEHDSSISTVIYDFRTPGGDVCGVPEVGRKIKNSRKDTIAFTGSMCCSGGIWLASQCQRFYGTPSSRIGSVGVYTMCIEMTAALEKEGVKIDPVFAGKYKLLGAYWKEMTKDERAILQARVDKIYAEFKTAMESYRQVSDEHYGNGLVFDGEDAAAIGFTDGCVESIEDILDGMV